MLIEMLKYEKESQRMKPTLSFISYVAYNCREVGHYYPQVLQVLNSETVKSSLFEL